MGSLLLIGITLTCGQLDTSAPVAAVAFAQAEEPEPIEVAAPFLPPAVAPELAKGLVPTGAPVTLPDRWWLMRQLQGTWIGADLDDSRMYLNGWFDMSFTASTAAVSNQPVVWNDRANSFLLQQGWFRFGRSVVASGTTEPTFGFQVDVLTGSDYRFTLPRGLFNSQLVNSTGAQNLYGVDPIQHYVSMYVPGLFRGVEFRLAGCLRPGVLRATRRSARHCCRAPTPSTGVRPSLIAAWRPSSPSAPHGRACSCWPTAMTCISAIRRRKRVS